MLTFIIFIIVLGILVLVHELGHFVVAKKSGMKVEEFGFGFPPRLFGFKKGETTYSINWIPFGGFVKVMGEDGQNPNDPRSFAAAKASTRANVLVAGVVMNVLLAVVLLSIANGVGLRVGLIEGDSAMQAEDVRVQVIQVAPGSPAEQAGLKVLDEIIAFSENGHRFELKTVEQVQDAILAHKGRDVILEIKNGDQINTKNIYVRSDPPLGEGAVGISLASTGVIRYPWYKAPWHGIIDTANITAYTAVGYGTIIKNLVTKGNPGMELSGPVGIAVVTGQAARIGFTYLMQFTALISVNLAILNIIPFPALDGGRLLFVVIEKLRRRPISKKVEAIVNSVGFALLIMLMIYVTTKDVLKFF
ncbi:MAG TPA: site-2 protease family protein [Candidatus Paceibacterota bacterium]